MPRYHDWPAFMREVRDAVETFLAQAFASSPTTLVRQAAEHVALGGGHRWRAMVAVSAGLIFREDALAVTLPTACGIELAHAASLTLDDLPSMDDAAIRRGKPCVHRCFPRWVADLLPVYLVNMAYRLSLNNPLVNAERRVEAALEMAKAGDLMARGQEADVTQSPRGGLSAAELEALYRHKTGALYAAAARCGATLCGATKQEAGALADCGMNLGLAYQLLDDVADRVATAAQLGKPAGMDRGKTTGAALFGVEAAGRKAEEFLATALTSLDRMGMEADVLRQLVRQLHCGVY